MTRCLGGAPCVAMVLALCAFDAGARGQAPARTELANAGLEQGSPGEAPTGWFFSSSCGGKASIDADEPFAGAQSALIDASAPTGSGQLFSNLMQSLDAQPWRGKRVRFRAAVRTAELAAGAAAQLWFRVDRPDAEGGGKQYGAFDNMGDRPIRAAAWAPYDIVLQVAADAERIVCGMFVTGKGKAWLDDASLAVVDESVATTGEAAASAANSRMHPAVRRAFGEAENAPRQPFFTPWLWLPVFALLTFAVALWPMRRRGDVDGVVVAPPGRVRWFAIRFTIAYWLLYCLPSPFAQLLPWLGPQLGAAHGWLDARLVALVARSVFGIEADLVPPNGSGDTTWSYISTLNGFVLAVLVAAI
ncbi:MAG TPA: hypothetical protein VFZ65_10305, partial [Planctomycetota bacterium]|nr:hypothetical protein [Planctomycetota bacterium]